MHFGLNSSKQCLSGISGNLKPSEGVSIVFKIKTFEGTSDTLPSKLEDFGFRESQLMSNTTRGLCRQIKASELMKG